MPFVLDDDYSSKMILDDEVAGAETVQINEGTLKGGGKTDGATHDQDEIYYVVKGEAVLHLDDIASDVKAGSLVFIPAGVFHSLKNKSDTEAAVVFQQIANHSKHKVILLLVPHPRIEQGVY
jgi:quercetin dioxygenase-like cupin family protein